MLAHARIRSPSDDEQSHMRKLDERDACHSSIDLLRSPDASIGAQP